MPEISYVPARKGGWMLLTHGTTVLAIDLPPESPRVSELWSVLAVGAAVEGVLDEVIRTGISKAPAFIVVGGADPKSTTVLVRGSGALRVASGTTVREISGEGVSSWSEQIVDTSAGFEFWPPSVPEKAPTLPLMVGVVWAAAFRQGEPALSVAPIAPAEAVSKTVESAEPVAQIPAKAPVDLEATLASQTTTVTPVVAPPPLEETAPDSTGYDHLFGETVFRNVEDAAVRAPGELITGDVVGPPPTNVGTDGGDHDGHTVMVSDMAALRAKRRAARSASSTPEPAVQTFYLELSTGGREVLDQPLVIGRAPTASRVPGGQVPRLVSMNTSNQDISRTHAQVIAEGGTVVVTDLHSSNGTMITLPGRAAQKLRPGEPATVIVGTVIDLGDGATLTLYESS